MRRDEERPALPPDPQAEGRGAGRAWALAELDRGYRHPIEPAPATGERWRILITDPRAERIFDGLCAGRPPRYVRGFVEGVASVDAESAGGHGFHQSSSSSTEVGSVVDGASSASVPPPSRSS